jgi:hypothetical protein
MSWKRVERVEQVNTEQHRRKNLGSPSWQEDEDDP